MVSRPIGIPLWTTEKYSIQSSFPRRRVTSPRCSRICGQAAATEYLSGPSARAYLDESLFEEAGIDVIWMEYDGYPEYDQLYPPFEHQVTVLDLIFHTGPQAPDHMLTGSGR